MSNMHKMKIEIWSDVACPFCYIGKHRFETALNQFPESEHIEVEWKNFMLNPGLKTNPNLSITEYLSKEKGIPAAQIKNMNLRVVEMAREMGLNLNIDNIVVANTFMAHNLIQYAATRGKQNMAEELLFESYFTHGHNVDNIEVLLQLAAKMGFDPTEVKQVLENKTYTQQVHSDVNEARKLGISGVPFFLFNRSFAISGAQSVETFVNALRKSFAEWRSKNPISEVEVTEGLSCNVDGECN